MGRWTFIATQSARLATLLFFVPILFGATVYRPNETRLAFLSNSEKDPRSAVEAPMLPPQTDANPFNGRWIFTGAAGRARYRRSSRTARTAR
jgi:hypothetical protein